MKIDSIIAFANVEFGGFANLRDKSIGQIAWNLKN